jgi:hypothetical protein
VWVVAAPPPPLNVMYQIDEHLMSHALLVLSNKNDHLTSGMKEEVVQQETYDICDG